MGQEKNPLISVIIPTYNDVNYIQDALQSIDHFLSNISHEIIVVDDGSSDGTMQLLTKLTKKYSIHLYPQKHQGVSSARNLGITQSNGRYIMFCDGDDQLVGHLPEFADADIVSFSANCRLPQKIEGSQGRLKLIASMFGFGQEKADFPAFYGGSVSKLFARVMVQSHHLSFDPVLSNSEDVFFNAKAICMAHQIRVYTHGFYQYCHHGNSVTHSYDELLLTNHCYFMRRIRKLLVQISGYQSLYQRVLSLYLYQLIFRQFAMSKNYHMLYQQWVQAVGQDHWNENLNRPIERLTIQLVNHFGIHAAVLLARSYLQVKKFVKKGTQGTEIL